jgi:hypothetical protein
MTESGKKNGPVRTLIVKNFSVIKEAKLEFGKITVLIGPEAVGKSLMCKLAFFVTSEIPVLAVESALAGQTWSFFESAVSQKFREWFPLERWGLKPIFISFRSQEYLVEFNGDRSDPTNQWLRAKFSEEFVNVYSSLLSEKNQPGYVGPPQLQREREWAWAKFMALSDPSLIEMPTYVPAGRALFVNSATGFTALQNPEIDPTVRLFAKEIAWNKANWLVGTLSSGRGITQQISGAFEHLMGGQVLMDGNAPQFRTVDARVLPLSFLSSGTQELLPLLNVLERQVYWQEHRVVYNEGARSFDGVPQTPGDTRPMFYVEEPEAHVFPSTQNKLVRYMVWLSNDLLLNFSWAITTHSPYILSSFNNLIYAGQLGENDAIRRKISIEKKYWIEPGSFRAYSIHDGVLKPILSKSGLINAEYLDGVSEEIGSEFDSLLRLEHESTKAS